MFAPGIYPLIQIVVGAEANMTDKRTLNEKKPEPGSADDLFPKSPGADPAADIEKEGEPDGGGNFA